MRKRLARPALLRRCHVLGAAQLFVLGIVGEYVGRILRETRKRPSYIVAETEADQRAVVGHVTAAE